ncbi:MAG: hypothetical protein PHE27_04870 [Alphaproteobacteria bacterium]|nr:hypothetical protein [Alphaproteobacteria bacterium]
MRLIFMALISIFAFSCVPSAFAAQMCVGSGSVLRGAFVEERRVGALDGTALRFSGRFVAAPDHGLIWSIEKPFPTTTVVTRNGARQLIGSVSMKMKIKNLDRFYNIVGSALAGNWAAFEKDFSVSHIGNSERWSVLLTPKTEGTKIPYSSVTVSGSRFVERIVLADEEGDLDTLSFADEVLSPLPLQDSEAATFAKISGK